MLRVVDVSSHQGNIVAGGLDCDAVICKATEGTGYVNPFCDEQYQSAKAAGKLLGVYHYASGGNPEAEAEFFINNVQGYLHEAILVLDWESGDNAAWGDSSWVARFCAHIVALTGINPMIYVQRSAASQCTGLGDYGIWLAEYPDYAARGWDAYYPPNYSGDYAMHQFTSSGNIAGYAGPLDLSLFFGDETAWRAYAGASSQSVPAPQPQPYVEPEVQAYTQPVVQTDGTTYIVQPGDTLSGIAARYGTTYQSLAAINNIADPNRIYPGQEIVIDGAATEASTEYYTIQPGDTLSGIASTYGTTWQRLAEINGIDTPDLIHPGTTIRVR
jgi:GH25 family lysozyme M1 (1,4-beta-N-acetylmuramidase)/LysM repeat protein